MLNIHAAIGFHHCATYAGGIYAPLSLLMSTASSSPLDNHTEAEAPQNLAVLVQTSAVNAVLETHV